MAKEKEVTISISAKSVRHYEMLEAMAKEKGVPVTDLINDGINQMCMQELANVHMSMGAYAALADGATDMLQSVDMHDGSHMITLKENDAYRKYADLIDKYVRG